MQVCGGFFQTIPSICIAAAIVQRWVGLGGGGLDTTDMATVLEGVMVEEVSSTPDHQILLRCGHVLYIHPLPSCSLQGV